PLPIEVFKDDAAAVWEDVVPVRCHAPNITASNGAGVRVEQDLGSIESMALFRTPWSIHSIPVLHRLHVQVEDGHGPGMADPEPLRELDLRLRLWAALVKEDQGAGRGG